MIIRDLVNMVKKEKRKRAHAKVAHKMVLGLGVVSVGVAMGILAAPKAGKDTRNDLKRIAGNNLKSMKDVVQNKAVIVKDAAVRTKKQISKGIKDVNKVTTDVKDDINNAHNEIKKDVNKTAKKIPRELKSR